jgi:hypothetical protein
MSNWCQNSIIIPTSAVKPFVKKFCISKKNRRFKLKVRTEHHLDFNRVLPMPKNAHQTWAYDNWNTSGNSVRTEFHQWKDGFTQITFDTAWSQASNGLLSEIAKRLNVDVEHSWLELGCDLWGTVKYQPSADDANNPFVHNGTQSFEMEKTEDQYGYVAELFYGDSCYTDELVQKHNGTWEEDWALEDEDEDEDETH